jgi:hypothetical protein
MTPCAMPAFRHYRRRRAVHSAPITSAMRSSAGAPKLWPAANSTLRLTRFGYILSACIHRLERSSPSTNGRDKGGTLDPEIEGEGVDGAPLRTHCAPISIYF